MIKATLRTSIPKKAQPEASPVPDGQVIEAEVVSNETASTGPAIESSLGAGADAGSEDLSKLLPPQNAPSAAPDAPVDSHADHKPTTSAVAARPKQDIVRHAPVQTMGFEGDWGADDVKFPQLKLVQGSGPLSQQFDVGTLIYGELELLPPPSVKPDAVNPALRFAPVTITKQWREKLSQDQVAEGLMPRVVETLAEVEAAGGTTRWLGSEMPDNLWEPSARCIFLIERPEGNDHPGFALELDGRQFAVAIYYAAGGAFRDSARVIFNTAMTSLLVPMLDAENKPVINKGRPVKKPMLYKCFWRLTFAKKQAGNFTPWRPTVKLLSKEETGPEVRAYCENLLQNSADNTAVAAE